MKKESKVIQIEQKRSEINEERKLSLRTTRKKKRKISFINALFVIFVAYFIFTISKQHMRIMELDEQIAEKQETKSKLEDKAKELESDVAKISDQNVLLDIVEKVARNDYKMVKPNETIYIDRNKVENKFISGIGSADDEVTDDEKDDSTSKDSENNN